MADPFSTASAALSVLDICWRLSSYLRSVYKLAKDLPQEAAALEREIRTFEATYQSLEKLCTLTSTPAPSTGSNSPPHEDPSRALWERAAQLITEGQHLVEQLEQLYIASVGSRKSPKPSKLDDIFKAVKLLAKSDAYTKLYSRFSIFNLELSMILNAIQLTTNSLFQSKVYASLDQVPKKLSQEIQDLGMQVKLQVERLRDQDGVVSNATEFRIVYLLTMKQLEPSIISAKRAITFASLNKHFYVQKPDTSIWTGRHKKLEHVRGAIFNRDTRSESVQRRFVVHGIPGAGKTQFCCKFAQDYRESFWGIFWIDASNEHNASESWKRIAKIGGKDANQDAGKFWLSNSQGPWLLIIDSADNSESFIDNQFPSGERGCILITTRNPRLRITETVGFLTLDRLEEVEANELLRKATNHQPWNEAARENASTISKHLGYLPLALVHAGRAIFHRLCTLQGYISFFNQTLSDLGRRKMIRVPDQSGDGDDGVGAFTTFDIIYSGLETQALRNSGRSTTAYDAIELINIFAFLHYADINLTLFANAGRNLRQVAQLRERDALPPFTTWRKRIADFVAYLYISFIRPTPVLPQILRSSGLQPFNEPRARRAIDLLVRLSLLFESSEPGNYSIHPLVHVWIRNRLNASAQALWCGVAADVLANAIKIPPMTDEMGDQDFYVRILPHIEEVQRNQDSIREYLWRNAQESSFYRLGLWRSTPPELTTSNVLNLAKFSRVYMECAKFAEAESLQRTVRGYVLKRFGAENGFVIPISLALAASLWHLGRPSESQQLQEEALRIAKTKLGDNNAQTLKIKDALGETYWQRGRLKEAKVLHQEAIDGMQGRDDLKRDRLKAMTHLGHVFEWYGEFDTALTFHEEAFAELDESCGPSDPDTITAEDSLAMTLLQKGGLAEVHRSNKIMESVYDRRLTRLGEEHLYTLWAECNLARTLVALAALEQDKDYIAKAKNMYEHGLAICRRNLGPTHIGTLMGRAFMASALVVEEEYDAAEREMKEVAELQKSLPGARAGSHRDRLVTLTALAECYEAQNRVDEASEAYDTFLKELDDMGGQEHPWRARIAEKRQSLLEEPRRLPDAEVTSDELFQQIV